MKIPKPELNTSLWDEKEWQPKIEKFSFLYAIIIMANIFTGIMINNYYLIVFNAMGLTVSILATLSYNKWKKEKGKQK